jgi:hypothetical protein
MTAARQFVWLPAGNQGELLAIWRREQLSARELRGTVDLLLAAPTRQQELFILTDPRRAEQRVATQSDSRFFNSRLPT